MVGELDVADQRRHPRRLLERVEAGHGRVIGVEQQPHSRVAHPLDERRRDEVAGSARAAAEVVTAAGGDRVNLLAGRFTPDRPEDDQLASAAEAVRAAADAVAPLGATIVVEHLNAVEVDRPLLPTPAAAAAFVERVAHPGVQVLFDAYHAAMAGMDPLEEAARVAPLTGHVQFADHPGRGAPGTGTLDLWALLDRLEALGYDGAVGLEFIPGGATPPRPRRSGSPGRPSGRR